MLNHSHIAAETAIRLCQFQANVSAAEHDQVRGHAVKLERHDVGERPGVSEPSDGRDYCARSCVEKYTLAPKYSSSADPQTHLQRFRRHEPPISHDQFGAALPVEILMQGDERIHH